MNTCTLLFSLLLVSTFVSAQQPDAVNSAAMKRALSHEPARLDADGKPTKVYTKAADPEKSRVYTKGAKVIITHASGVVDERPYVALPILFKVGTAELLHDGVSAENVKKTADVLRDLVATGGSFCIEGHASAEGDPAFNKTLSADRAAKIMSLLTDAHALPESALNAKGFGNKFASAKVGDGEAALQQDRRVLVVRTK